jgi:hypothetical protein
MFRYQLRTLLIVLGAAPPLLGGIWWLAHLHPILSAMATACVISGAFTWAVFWEQARLKPRG